MRRAERLYRLVNEMRTRGSTRASELAISLEVSISTIYRDVAHLQASGVPIEGEAGVGYLVRPGFDLPNVTFTNDQIDALAVGLAFVESTGDPVLATAAREARAKIQAGLPEPEERRLADAPYYSLQPRYSHGDFAALLRDAVRNSHFVEFSYADAQGHRSVRRVRPLVIWNLIEGGMFSAWCELRHGFRTFRFDRISDLASTGEMFDDEETKGLRAFMEMEKCHSQEHSIRSEAPLAPVFRPSEEFPEVTERKN